MPLPSPTNGRSAGGAPLQRLPLSRMGFGAFCFGQAGSWSMRKPAAEAACQAQAVYERQQLSSQALLQQLQELCH